MDQEEATTMQDTLTTDANETDIYERRKRTTRVYDGSGRYDGRWTTSTKIQHALTTDTNKRHERKVPHKFYGNDGCVRHDERRTRSTEIQYTFTTDTNDRSTMVQHTIYDESERHKDG